MVGGLAIAAFAQKQTPIDTIQVVDVEIEEADTNLQYYFVEEDYIDSLPIFIERFGKDKIVPDSLQLPFYIALSRYPELHNNKIVVEGSIMFNTMQARPAQKSIFRKASKRTYKIFINNRKGKYKGISLAKMNFNTRIGFFGHELAHLLSYKYKNSLELVGMGAKYIFSKKYKRYTERQTDMETIRRGLGFALYESKKLILYGNNTGITPEYRRNARRNYMTDTEVLENIRVIGFENMASHRPKKY